MKRTIALLLAFCMLPLFGVEYCEIAQAAEFDKILCSATVEDNFIEDEILITVFPEWDETVYTPSDFENIGCISVEEIFDGDRTDIPSRILLLKLEYASKENVLSAIKLLEERVDIFAAEPNFSLSLSAQPDDTYYTGGAQWAINMIDLPEAWEITTGSSSILVGVIDTGIDASHPDLKNRVNEELSCCFTPDYDNPLEDINGHGTHVAGIIGAEGNNARGVVGACWNVELVSLRVDKEDGTNDVSGVVSAINYARENGIPILNYSGYIITSSSTPLTAIANYPGLLVCSAGNDAENTDTNAHYPSGYNLDNIISVGASDNSDDIWECYDSNGVLKGSNYGQATVDVFAPGVGVMSTLPDAKYGLLTGTSMATPYVTGVAALILSAYPDMNAAQIKKSIMNNVDFAYTEDGDSVFGNLCVSGGRLNAYKALQHIYDYTKENSVYHNCTCEDCEYSFIEVHSWIYESTGSQFHTRICDECGYATDLAHMLTNTATDSLYNHTVYCTLCEYEYAEAHEWLDQGSYYQCSICAMTSNFIPIVGQSVSAYALVSGETIYVDENTIICYYKGQYYYVKASTEAEAITYLQRTKEKLT